MKCKECGTIIEEREVQFCNNCGNKLKKTTLKNKEFQYGKFSLFDMIFHSMDLFNYNKKVIFQIGILFSMFFFMLSMITLNNFVIKSVGLFLSIFMITPFSYLSTIKYEQNNKSIFSDIFYGFKISRDLLGLFILIFSITIIEEVLFTYLDDLYVLLKIHSFLGFKDYISGINIVIYFFVGNVTLYSQYLILEKKVI